MTRPESYNGNADCWTCKHCVFRQKNVKYSQYWLDPECVTVGFCNVDGSIDKSLPSWELPNEIREHCFCDQYQHSPIKQHSEHDRDNPKRTEMVKDDVDRHLKQGKYAPVLKAEKPMHALEWVWALLCLIVVLGLSSALAWCFWWLL